MAPMTPPLDTPLLSTRSVMSDLILHLHSEMAMHATKLYTCTFSNLCFIFNRRRRIFHAMSARMITAHVGTLLIPHSVFVCKSVTATVW